MSTPGTEAARPASAPEPIGKAALIASVGGARGYADWTNPDHRVRRPDVAIGDLSTWWVYLIGPVVGAMIAVGGRLCAARARQSPGSRRRRGHAAPPGRLKVTATPPQRDHPHATARVMAGVLHLPAAGGQALEAGLQARSAALRGLGGKPLFMARVTSPATRLLHCFGRHYSLSYSRKAKFKIIFPNG